MADKEFDQSRYRAGCLDAKPRDAFWGRENKFKKIVELISNLSFFIINNLPDRVFRVLLITTILALISSACASTSPITKPYDPLPGETTGLPDSATGEAPVITSTARPTITATPAPTETQVVNQVDQLLTAYLAGESIDVSVLSPTEFREFSTQLAEQRNEERGINPIIYNNEAYINPDNYMMMNYDGHPDMNETIQMYLPIVGKDSAGNLQILNQDGHTITIANSADVDWSMRVTDPHDPRIDWPTTEIYESGYTEAQHRVNLGYTLFPAILLEKDYGVIFLEGSNGADGGWEKSIYRFLIIETDQSKNPILAREILVMGGPKMYRYEEGSNLGVPSGITVERDYLEFHKDMPENCVYYLAGNHDEVKTFGEKGMDVTMDNYSGLVYGNEAFNLINNNQMENKVDYILFANTILIKKAE